jgi:ATP-dependent DNA helicase DinG
MKHHVDVEGMLGVRGALSAAMPGFELRPQQVQLARAVERALAEGTHLVAEAGTGTGKTLAYLVPAALSGKKVIISTATRNLQDQIFLKDIPLLRDGVGLQFEAALLKGRANYLCAHRFESFEKAPLFASPDDATHFAALRQWAVRTESGDRGESQLPDDWPSWTMLSTNSDNCLGGKCPLYESCFVTRARRGAEDAKLVVVNHALFFADLALRARGGDEGLRVLPHYDAVIFDEAHALEDVATEHFSVGVTSGALLTLGNDAVKQRGALAAMGLKLRDAAHGFFRDVQRAFYGDLREGDGGDVRLDEKRVEPLRPKAKMLLETLAGLAAMTSDDEAELAAIHRRAREAASQLDFLLRADEPTHVFWAQHRGRSTALRAAPIEIGPTLAKRLYGAVDTVVFTSATLCAPAAAPSDEGAFSFAVERFGLSRRPHETLKVDSPFDWPRQAGLYLPQSLPEPSAPDFLDAAEPEVQRLLELTGGRAFVLFTSLRAMEAMHARLAPKLPGQVLLQGQRPRRALLEAFVAQPSVLFASQSFWEGVDVPGDALSLVIIDKLPFAPPNEPLTAARIETVRSRGGEPFDGFQVPQAALALRQGFGRLIRTRTDRGVVALLDVRVSKKRYGKALLDALPPARRFTRFEDVARWYRDGGQERE